ncbi:hypothetical protein [Terasakiella sp. SH-1]|uniref:hypothetical protein n=1 Tax=Terasakiella sp. SH-1 TaxID=2560057 RepID=UPI0010748A7E|nr:hypothetical protein [Terasakiella sp. SH-1]
MEEFQQRQLEKSEKKLEILDSILALQNACFVAEDQVDYNVGHLTAMAHQTEPYEHDKIRYLSYWIKRYGSVYKDIAKIHQFAKDESDLLSDPDYEPWENVTENINNIRDSILRKAMAAHDEVNNGLRS